MQRRNALKAAATLLAGAGVSSIANGSVKRPSAQYPATKRSRFPYLEVGERTTLFFKDWDGRTRGRLCAWLAIALGHVAVPDQWRTAWAFLLLTWTCLTATC
jgi:hypothetical protein